MSNEVDWSGAVVNRIGKTVRTLRGARTVQWLSDETHAVGKRVAKASISELENGNRKVVAITDLLILAAALHVHPIQLLYPDMPDGQVDALPGRSVTSWEAAQWFSGGLQQSAILVDPDIDPGVSAWSREREQLQRRINRVQRSLDIRTALDADGRERYQADLDEYQDRLQTVERHIRALGGVVVEQGRI
ncbi:hypothetical protein [Williamsia herbipolensis]|uniref:hypothetical protein n=1 Tax=Williamsia herbipolensis TaxID=1603258 RepID=UPI0012376BC7|nr:hypothetical protein [Williamsia herbipolensis]